MRLIFRRRAGGPSPERTSDLLIGMLSGSEKERLSIGEMIDSLGDRAFGVLILLCALPNCIPGPPGLSTVTGLPIVIFSIQLILGSHRPWLPEFLRSRSFVRQDLLNLVRKAEPWLRRLERISRPRLGGLIHGPAERFAGAVILMLSFILVLPIPLGNLFPALAIAIIALALMEQDGLAVLVGYVGAILSTAIALASVIILFAVMAEFIRRLLG